MQLRFDSVQEMIDFLQSQGYTVVKGTSIPQIPTTPVYPTTPQYPVYPSYPIWIGMPDCTYSVSCDTTHKPKH